MTNAELIFPETWQLDGFTTNVTSRQAGEPDPVVREILQNSLDAAIREARRDYAEIHFTIATHPLTDLPGYDSYVQAFKAAKAELKQPVTHDVRSAVARIERVLNEQRMSVLFCRDNGIGLDPNRMKALLSEGQSDKAIQGAGSYGLGHLTAYAASDLRYILYAGKREGTEIASGHTILASHKERNARHSAHGYWRTPTDVFSLEDGNYPKVAPPLVRDQVERISTSGSVVAIAGFNYFHDDQRRQALDDICRVAALNFLGAIHEGKMVVHVIDEDSGRRETVNTESLEKLLKGIREQQRAPAAGWLPGQQGYRSWQTLRNGSVLDAQIDRSIKAMFRPLGANSSDRSRVQIFRDGMWITNNAPELGPGAFGGVQPFDAVLLLSDADPDDHTEFYDLVRNSEGPEHRGLTKLRELPAKERKQLRDMLRRVAQRLKQEAGEIDADQGFTPSGFAVFNANVHRAAAIVPRLRHRPIVTETDSDAPATDPRGATAPGGQSADSPGKGTRQRHQRRAPAAGTAIRIRRAIVPRLEPDGSVRRLSALLKLDDPSAVGADLGLRVFVESGSDESCEQPLSPVWQPIRAVSFNGIVVDGRGESEVTIPSTVEALEIELAEPVGSAARFELDVVRRRTKGAQV